MLPALYYMSTISIIYLLFRYPKYWAIYMNRPDYEIRQIDTYLVISAVNTTSNDCFRIMSEKDAISRLQFANNINTELVISFAVVDWIIVLIGGVASTILWYKSRHTPSVKLLRQHTIVEIIGLLSLLAFSPLSYPAVIDTYSDCLDDNWLMKYNNYAGIFVVVVITAITSSLYGGILYYGLENNFASKVISLIALLTAGIMLVASIWVTYVINSMFSMMITVVQTAVALYTLYEDYINSHKPEILGCE
ncbi:hypothetical protein SteCoe_18184 [Stentor coeruleus]|uniref:Uncharacterized protein n=1 Tax=Stentor coeruleus TaxID=5963 RepID=A0A1R2BX62_9CILI|nr:hypothetical protein SteCoe_18184 [Stentor coeruleus]